MNKVARDIAHKSAMAWALMLSLLILLPLSAEAQRLLTLDSCRAMALRNNKQMSVSKAKQEVAANVRKSARTKYLPHVGALGGYVWTSKEISILNDDQKSALNNLGTNTVNGLTSKLTPYASILPPAMQMQIASDLGSLAGVLNRRGRVSSTAFVPILETSLQVLWWSRNQCLWVEPS